MRPIELTMQAFGPYSHETVIPFDKIASEGLYLICGDTGSGKTMLFDAITYALYGEASGQNRDTSMLRSKYAKIDESTFVKLIFENRGEIYTVFREWGREKIKKGTITEERSSDAWIKYPDGHVVSKHKDVTAAVTDIIGLDRDRFAKTVMIAQGEFRQLLFADTKERMQILRRIFKTDIFDRFSQNAKTAAKKAETDAESIRRDARKYADLLLSDDDELCELLSAVPDVSCDAIKCSLKRVDGEMNERLKHISVKLDALNKKEKNTRLKLSRADIDRKREEEAAISSVSVQKAEYQLALAKENAAKTEKYAEKAALLNEKATVYKNELPIYAELEALHNALKNEQLLLNEAEQKLEKNQRRIKAAEEELKISEDFLAKNKNVSENHRLLEAKLNELTAEQKQLLRLKEQISELRSQKNSCDAKKTDYEAALISLTEARNRHTDALRAYFDGIAGVLSESLAAGEPCPVCGSVDHPCPAPSNLSDITRDLIDKLSLESEAASEKAEACASSLAECMGNLTQLTSMIENACAELGINASADKAIISVSPRLEKIEMEIASTLDEINDLTRLMAEISDMSERCDRLKKLLLAEKESASILSANYAEKNTVIREKQAYADSLSEKLSFESVDDMTAEIKKLTTEADTLILMKENAEKQLLEAEKNYSSLKSALDTLTEQLKDSTASKYSDLEKLCAILDESIRSVSEEKLTLLSAVEKNRTISELLINSMAALESAESNAVMYASISDTANGSINGKEKIMLEAFWQMRLFERILRRASIRLMKMTDGRYELIRRKTASNQRSISGLDLDILDHWNGSVRSVKSLSGGEAFAASLSLALALSDETEAEAGGVKIDALFIDEGFGSLDEESLTQAMAVLEAQSEGGRSVGIISHVEALRERITKKIVVKKHCGTSTVKLEGV